MWSLVIYVMKAPTGLVVIDRWSLFVVSSGLTVCVSCSLSQKRGVIYGRSPSGNVDRKHRSVERVVKVAFFLTNCINNSRNKPIRVKAMPRTENF